MLPFETPRDEDCCSWAILNDALLEIPDTTRDVRTSSLEIVTGELGVQMYVGESPRVL
jgi:hypothetical protein